jgi:glyoxylase-like metal-dependent hydrolase (beta-lactamase superfamily II)
MPLMLPSSMHLFERGWLSANNVLFTDNDQTVLVDSGYGLHAPQTVALLKHALQGRPLDWLVNTHCHSDHMGGNAAIQRHWACRTSVPAGEAALIDRWDDTALVLGFADQRAEPFRYDDTFTEGDVLRMGGIDWQVIAAPGHDEHAVMFHSARERILISGDALWENGFGVVFGTILPPPHYRPDALRETRETLERIATLDIGTVIPGHGGPFNDIPATLERALSRIRGFEADPVRHARHAAKVMLVFALLDHQRIAIDRLEAYVAGVPILQTLNERFLHLTTRQLADYLVSDLKRAGAVTEENGDLVPRAGI